jgi:hypothetical protein
MNEQLNAIMESLAKKLHAEAEAERIGDNASRQIEGRQPLVCGNAYVVRCDDPAKNKYADALERAMNRLYGPGTVQHEHIRRATQDMNTRLVWSIVTGDDPAAVAEWAKQEQATALTAIVTDAAQRHGPSLPSVREGM